MGENKKKLEFELSNTNEVNQIICHISIIFFILFWVLYAASYYRVIKVSCSDVLEIILYLSSLQISMFLLIKLKAPAVFVKYFCLIILLGIMAAMVANAYFGIGICIILTPAISCLYFDRTFTLQISILGYIAMIIALWFRSAGVIELAYPGYTRMSWFIAFGLGYTLEYIALSAILIAFAGRAKKNLNNLFDKNERILDIQNKIIFRFAGLIEFRDNSTGQHVKRTSQYVKIIAEKLQEKGIYLDQLTKFNIKNIILAAPLHDIGKIKISDTILLKPGNLTPEEFSIIKNHSEEGCTIIANTIGGIEQDDFVQTAKDMALYHHEKWDGSGYPHGLIGEEIPISARIMAVADVFDALISNRCYKPAYSIEKAFEIIEESKGSHFDPQIAECFIVSRKEIEKIIFE